MNHSQIYHEISKKLIQNRGQVLILAKRSDLCYRNRYGILCLRIIQFIFGFLAVGGCRDVVRGLLIDFTVDVADPPDICILALLDDHTITPVAAFNHIAAGHFNPDYQKKFMDVCATSLGYYKLGKKGYGITKSEYKQYKYVAGWRFFYRCNSTFF